MKNSPLIRLQSLMIVFISLGLFYSCSTNDDATDVAQSNISVDEGPENVWISMDKGISGTVFAFTEYEDKLVAGGWFGSLNYVAQWDGMEWQPMGTGVADAVKTFTIYNNELIAGGLFDHRTGAEASGISRWDGVSWQPMPTGNIRPIEDETVVYSLAVYEGDLIAGGTFNHAANQTANGISRWTGSQWEAMGEGSYPAGQSLIVHNGELISDGHQWNGSEWQLLGSNIGARTHLVYNGKLIAGTDDGSVASWNGTKWEQLGSRLGTGADNRMIRALAEYDGDLIATGDFSAAGGDPANGISRWNGSTWQSMNLNTTENIVSALIVFNGDLIGGGEFHLPQSPNFIKRWGLE